MIFCINAMKYFDMSGIQINWITQRRAFLFVILSINYKGKFQKIHYDTLVTLLANTKTSTKMLSNA